MGGTISRLFNPPGYIEPGILVGKQGVCPAGWHIPTLREFEEFCDSAQLPFCMRNGVSWVEVLKLPRVIARNQTSGNYVEFGKYWTSSTVGYQSV